MGIMLGFPKGKYLVHGVVSHQNGGKESARSSAVLYIAGINAES